MINGDSLGPGLAASQLILAQSNSLNQTWLRNQKLREISFIYPGVSLTSPPFFLNTSIPTLQDLQWGALRSLSISRAGPKIGYSWETFTKRTEKKEGEKKALSSARKKKAMVMMGKCSSTGTILEFLLPRTLQIAGNTVSFLLHKFHSCEEEVNAAWNH